MQHCSALLWALPVKGLALAPCFGTNPPSEYTPLGTLQGQMETQAEEKLNKYVGAEEWRQVLGQG